MTNRERAATIRHWIQSARQRLRRAETYDPGEDTTLSCEDAQQAVELVLKGLIVTLGDEPKRTHDLVHLLRQVEQLGEQIPDAVRRCEGLSRFAGGERYEFITGEEQPPCGRERDEAIGSARAVLAWAVERIRNAAPEMKLTAGAEHPNPPEPG
jgi:HEPN domain-containing protein